MLILPAQIALKRGTEGQIGVLEKADTEKPEFVVETAEVRCDMENCNFSFNEFLSHYQLNDRVLSDFLVSSCQHPQHSSQ